ncbi:hypothetical protein GIW41_07890 [Pseudomonas sp. PA-6-1D]|uniref:Uncharacterized protein n=3 Tax=Pseudomonas edaphica TaxID=2006980 RepID=A0A7Y8E5J9_9PSED|nr:MULTISPECIES: hypothetical protein [Pseudomonas]MCF5140748.1 hypothetical protein [Pseudomonas sp. PA-6-3C]MCF5145915.1 hypothetical protein [Pseudomonas sp. PA-6-3F]MCF5161890.1 hypothetical protein [Pseudomonas sp. PA-6-2E]MCF5175164.1 hypothetical protein [Pseudomonas sp. PA-6-1D]MCF5191448.1 hypothetical protein [Pseudomonas sp. PA-6-1H]
MPLTDVNQQREGTLQNKRANALGAIRAGHVSRLIILLTALLACAAIAIHAPGQMSMDSSIQLYEAYTGQSVSWSPPFMSALLHWLGGGELSTAMFVLINAVLLYGAFAAVALTMLQIRAACGFDEIATWRVVLAFLLIMNPIIFIYAGIVWKDVLFASLLTAACACAIAATVGSSLRRYSCIGLSIVLLGAGYQARQQGVFMAPVLLLSPILAYYSFKPSRKLLAAAVIVVLFVGVVWGIQHQVNSTIKGADDRASSVGFRGIMQFDLAGIISDSKRSPGDFVFPITEEQFTAIKAAYDPSRIDFLDLNPVVHDWLAAIPPETLRQAWWAMVKQNPGAYLEHRATTFATLLGMRGLNGTLPVFVGVEGRPDYFAAVSIKQGTTQRAQKVYDMAAYFFNWPIYRHFFWMGLLVVIAVVGGRKTLPGAVKAIGASIALATILMYGSFLPTSIASDFRYLFGAIPLIMVLGLVLLLGVEEKRQA